MAKELHISQNAYSLIENGKTKLIDAERIEIIAKKFNINPLDLGLFDGLGVTLNFNDKVENGYASYILTLNAENKELVNALKEELQIKNKKIENLQIQNAQLMQHLFKKINNY